MKIWTGNFCRFILSSTLVLGACSSSQKSADSSEVSLKEDQARINELRKDVPEEVKKSNDRLGDMLKTWKDSQMEPEKLRDHFSDEIRKARLEIEKRHHRQRDDFNRAQQDKRRDFQDKQKSDREKFLDSKPSSEKRSTFMERQSEDRDRFNSDVRDERDEFEDRIREERKDFESDIADRWSEFRNEYPEYVKEYNERKMAKEKEREAKHDGYQQPQEPPPQMAPTIPPPAPGSNVNQGGNGWPSTNPTDLGH